MFQLLLELLCMPAKNPMKKILSIFILLISISFLTWGLASWETQLIQANKTTGSSPLVVQLSPTINDSSAQYKWSIGSDTLQYSRDFVHIFALPGSYEVSLDITDASWLTQSSSLSIIAQDETNCSDDYDGDSWNNCLDLCPLVAGSDDNTWCPTFDIPQVEQIESSCYYQADKNYIFGNAICNACPCEHTLSYNAQLRKCDILFPAITSADGSEIYEKWSFFEIK